MERKKMLNRATVFCAPNPNVRPWCRHRPLSHYGIAHFRRELITLYITNCRNSRSSPIRNSRRKPGPVSHWPILERTSPSRSVFDLTNRANHGPKTSPHRKGRYTAPDDCCGVPERVRNVHEKRDAEALTFPFVRIIASGDPVYSFLSGLSAR